VGVYIIIDRVAVCGVLDRDARVLPSGRWDDKGVRVLTLEAAALDPRIETAAVKRGLTPNSGDELDTDAGRARSPAAGHMSESDHHEELRRQVEDLVRVLHLSEAWA